MEGIEASEITESQLGKFLICYSLRLENFYSTCNNHRKAP